MSRRIPERYIWAVELLDIRADDEILEIGCGYGLAISLICERLESGYLIAIDRSAAMVKAAARANSDLIRDGKAKIVETDLLHFEIDLKFDKIFLFNINAFWMDPVEELSAIRRLLKPDGKFYIFHQPPPGHELPEFEHSFRKNLESNGFGPFETFINDREAVHSLCVISRPLSPR